MDGVHDFLKKKKWQQPRKPCKEDRVEVKVACKD